MTMQAKVAEMLGDDTYTRLTPAERERAVEAFKRRDSTSKADPAKRTCEACGTLGEHSDAECVARRPRCHVEICGEPTCVQALIYGCLPTCLSCYFERGIAVPKDGQPVVATAAPIESRATPGNPAERIDAGRFPCPDCGLLGLHLKAACRAAAAERPPASPVRVGDVYELGTARCCRRFEVSAFALVDDDGQSLSEARAIGVGSPQPSRESWPLSALLDAKRARLVTRGTGPDARGLLPGEDPTLIHGLDDFNHARLCPSGAGHASSFDGDVTCPVCRPAVDARRFSCTCCGLVAAAPPERDGRRFCARCSRFDPTDRQAPRPAAPRPAIETARERLQRLVAEDAAAHPEHAPARAVAVAALLERGGRGETMLRALLAALHAYERGRAPFGRWRFIPVPKQVAILTAAGDAASAVAEMPVDPVAVGYATAHYERARGTT